MDQTDPDTTNDGASASTTVNNDADISMTKVASPTTADEGDDVTYTVTVLNNGAAQATTLAVTDACPTGTTFVNSAPSTGTTYTAGTWTIGTLNNAASATLDLVCNIDAGQSGNMLTNTVATADISMDQTDPDTTNDGASASTTVNNNADISMTKTASPTTADEGDDVTYTVTVLNNGAAQATTLAVTDACPSGTTFVSSSPSTGTTYATGTWTIGTLNNAASATLDLVCNVDAGQSGNMLTNTVATADISMDQTDPDTTNDGASASTTVNNDACLLYTSPSPRDATLSRMPSSA